MIIKKDCNTTNCSSIYKEVIRPFFKLFTFFYDKIPQVRKAPKGSKKHQKALKSITNLKFIDTRFIDRHKILSTSIKTS